MKRTLSLITLLIFSGIISPPVLSEEKPYDFLIKGALVFDGESLVGIKRDIALLGDHIAQIGEIPAVQAKEVIEASGLIVAPGFIDLHTHSDFNPFVYPNLGNKVLQGVTTEVVGNCGMSAAPVEGPHTEEIRNVWAREGVPIPSEISWGSFKDYVNEAEFQGLETNFISLVGHGNLRSAVMGMSPGPAGPEQIQGMRQLLRTSLEEGAYGISFGLTYLPGIFAGEEELVALCQEAARKNAICAFHIRGEGGTLVEAVREALGVGKKAGARVHISHLKAQGGQNWPKIEEVFRLIEEARSQGMEVSADAYPYTASFAELGASLPPPIYEDPHRLDRFKDPGQREKLLEELRNHYAEHPVAWDRIRIATVGNKANVAFQGKSISEISGLLNRPPEVILTDLLTMEEFKVSAFYFSQNQEVIKKVLAKPYVAVGSDSIADGSALPHPRAYGTFPRLLRECSKKGAAESDPCWGRTIAQATGLPAGILGLRDRGRIGVSLEADLVIFDPLTVGDRASYENPKATSEGIRWVFVNGRPVVREGKYTPARTGVFLTRQE